MRGQTRAPLTAIQIRDNAQRQCDHSCVKVTVVELLPEFTASVLSELVFTDGVFNS